MRQIDEEAIKAHAAVRFRSEHDYAVFEYYRSAKVLAFLEGSGVSVGGRVLDAGCGPGGTGISVAEEATVVIGIDVADRFRQAGGRLARDLNVANVRFALADGMALPFPAETFELVLSHAVIEHVDDPLRYLRECGRVLTPHGRLYLSTAPYFSFAGAHLPRLKVPLPLHLFVGRRAAFATCRFLARYAAWMLREGRDATSFITLAARGERKQDDLRERVRVTRLRRQIAAAGLRIVRERLSSTSTVQRLPAAVGRWLRQNPFTQKFLINNMEYVLARDA